MTESRIKISSIVENQLPNYVKEEFPLVTEFLSQYYKAIENQGSTLDILQNIDRYVKVDNLTNLIDSTQTTSAVSLFDRTINVKSTYGFPDSYGLIKIDDEIITYKSKTATSFTECVRGFVGIEEYLNNDQLKFSDTSVESHDNGSSVENLSILFLKEFFNKVKKQVTPGFENRQLNSQINQALFVKQSNDFYSAKGTAHSFEILFRALYGKDVEVILPRDYLIQPSDAQYRITRDLVVESIEGNPIDLVNLTLYQDSVYDIPQSRGTISNVEKIVRGDKEYYVISLDYGFDNVNDTGLSLGEFSIHPKTRNLINVVSGADTLTVDSTLGFPSSGVLTVDLPNGTQLSINYKSKSSTQFYGCTGINQNIPKNSELNLNVFAYGYTNREKTNIIKVRVTGVLSDLNLDTPSKYYGKGDLIKIRTLGKKTNNFKANKWLFNISSTHNIKSVVELDALNFKYLITLYDQHLFYLGDSVTIVPPVAQPTSEVKGIVSSIKNSTSVVVTAEGGLNSFTPFQIRKNIINVSSSNNLSLNKYTANVQNTYLNGVGSVYVASPSLPHYADSILNIRDKKVTFSGTFSGDTLTIPNHKYHTGDKVVYNPDSNNKLNLDAGKYFVKRVDSNRIKLSRSLSDIFTGNYLNISGTVTDNILYYEPFTFENLSPKTVQSQKLIRQIAEPLNPGVYTNTPSGFTGIFINGVELLNYKSNDYIYYGPINSIDVISNGSNYDVINPPALQISDKIGFGATVYCNVNGSLSRVDIVDGGINYLETPKVIITGGNGSGAEVAANLESYDYLISFNSRQSAGYVDLSNNTIGFSSFHKLTNGEELIYQTNGQNGIGGITTNTSYFISVVDANTIKLHDKLSDALDGSNEVNLTLPYGDGTQTFKSKLKKRRIQSLTIVNPGSNYKNRRLSVNPVGINTANNSININNHNFNDKDIVSYQTTGSVISGLDTSKYYYVKQIDGNNFRLFNQYTIDDDKSIDFYYETNQPVNLESVGSGIHIFRDEPIQIKVVGSVGVTTFSNQNPDTFAAQLQPIFRGSIESVFVENGGFKYGTEDILNHNRQPEFLLNSGIGAQLKAIVVNGSIVEVFVISSGTGYNCPPDLVIESPTGSGAVLTPIVDQGLLVEVKVISGGVGYEQLTTSIDVLSAGQGAKFNATIKSWNVNTVERNINTEEISDDDGIINSGLNKNFGLEYSHAYAPRNLRKSAFSEKNVNGEVIYIADLNLENGKETLSDSHSPIIGWAYDGNPIYGPYGYSTPTGGVVKLLKSGYSILLQENRPSLDLYPEGFFVEDYDYIGDGDLDESNGRFCITPEYPNGTYAYFTTVSDVIETSGIFANYRKPIFPYVIGDHYHSSPIEFNFSPLSNQDDFNLNASGLLRNTTPYYLDSDNSFYQFIENPNRIKEQNSKVTNTFSGQVTSIDIVNSGDNYRVGEQILFDNEGTGGRGSKAYISSIEGKKIVGVSITTIQINNIELFGNIGISTYQLNQFNLKNGDFVTIQGKFPNQFSITQRINVISNRLILSSGIGSANYTGIVTFMSVYSPINASVNDLFYLGNEIVKILNIDTKNSRVRILRNQNGTTGVSSYSAGYALTESPTKFTYNSSDLGVNFFDNRELYFNALESVGVGSTSGVGVGVTLYFSNPGSGGTSLFVPTRSIYIPGHGIESGTELVYNSNGANTISISTDGISSFSLQNNSIVHCTRITEDLIGISTVPVYLNNSGNYVGLGSTNVGSLLYFTGIGTSSGLYHSFKLNPARKVIADISKNTVNVSTAETHDISVAENISITISPKLSTNLSIHYDDHNRRIYTNPLTFNSSNVDVASNTITINDHKLVTGQSVIYQEIQSVGGLIKNRIYYVINYGRNSIKLAESPYDISINKILDITSTGSGIICPVNPRIVVTKNNIVNFDVSDSSLSFTNNNVKYSAFDFKIYKNSNFTEEFNKIENSSSFNVIKTGRVGVDTNASVSLTFNDEFPDKLYYRLEPKNTSLLPLSKKQIIFDNELVGSGEIVFVDSLLTGSIPISGVGSTTFAYTIPLAPPETSYDTTSGVFEYERFTGKGKIKKIYLESGGANYKTLPNISEIRTTEGSGAVLYSNGDNIGSVNNVQIEDIGFSYSSDLTLRPSAKLPDILKIYTLSIFDRIGISSRGVNYIVPPDLVVIDGRTNKQITDVDLTYGMDDTEVKINRNVTGIYDVKPNIIPINNSNSIEIDSIVYDSVTKDVRLYLKPDYSSIEDFPFDIGEKIIIEGSTVNESSSTVRGYNSENYGYALFTVTSIDPNIGGSNASITYSLKDYLLDGESPGLPTADGFVTPKRYFPIFDISLKKLQFRIGETVSSNSSSGIVQLWDYENNNLKVATNKDFVVGEVITGESSGASAVVDKIYGSDVSYDVDSYSVVRNGWFKETGFLNKDTQRIQDSDYYQYFSYALKSEVSIDQWDESVGSLNHTAGFKRFSDLVINSNPGLVGLSTNQDKSKFIGIADLYSVKGLNCFDDFDLVYENYKKINNKHYSDEITFNSRILQDYIESIGNKVLKVDDISSQFNSNPRATRFTIVDKFNVNDCRSKKYIIYISDTELYNDRESVIVTLTHDGVNGYLNQYARVESSRDLGYFDFRIVGNEAQLLFYPLRYRFSNYDIKFLSFGIKDNIDTTRNYSLGNASKIQSHTSTISAGISSTRIVGISSDFRSSKILVQVGTTNKDYFEFNEINIVRGDNDVYFTEYGELTTGNYLVYSTDSVGTYSLYLDQNGIGVYFNLNEVSTKNYFINSISASLTDESFTGIGSTMIGGSLVRSNEIGISSSSNPQQNVVYQHNLDYNSSYYLISVEDLTNNRYQVSEVLVTNDDSNSYIVEYGVIETDVPLGSFDSNVSNNIVNLTFTPIRDISCKVKILAINNAFGKINGELDFFNAIINSGYAYYEGTEVKVKRDFELNYKQIPIFERTFDGSSSTIVNLEDNTIHIPNHNFVTGEQIEYTFNNGPIGIQTTNIVGLGVTDKLPKDLYVVKVNDLKISLSTSAQNALSGIPNIINITSVGIGSTHRFTSKKQNSKSLITIDNVIQSPIVSSNITTTLSRNVDLFDESIVVSGITSFFTGDIIQIDSEIMKIEAIETGERNLISIIRPWMGTRRSTHSSGSTVTKLKGDYNIVGNIISFISAPYGNIPEENAEKFDETDYTGLSTSSTFTGRIFLRSGIENSGFEAYHKNYIFDDISNQFNGIGTQFKLTSNYNDISGISTSNAIVLVNEIFQLPSKLGGSAQIIGNYDLKEHNQSTNIFFNENSNQYLSKDVNASKLPRGGIIVSVGSSNGMGYQPLVSAAGTAIITNAGLIESISIGNSGSGYRKDYQIVNVSVGTSSVYGDNITNIGTAQIQDGHIVNVSITNRGSGFSRANPPYVIFDAPLSYTNIPLIYSNSSNPGIGTECVVDIVVGNGSSVINFEIKNYGHNYLPNDILTVPITGNIGIPTYRNSNFEEFRIKIERTFNDKFSGWSLGDLQVLDSIANLFDGVRKQFPIRIDGQQTSIRSKYGSNIDVEQTLLIFINDVLQVPGEGYSFKGGSVITFPEPPNVGDDVKILFYRGTTDVDTVLVDVREFIEPGDLLQIKSDDFYLQQDKRLAKEIVSTDIVRTNNYPGPGLTNDNTNLRPVTLCKLLTDTVIDGQSITKDRLQYEPKIYPVTNIIQNVSVASTEIFVESVKTFFDSVDEYLQDGTSEKPQKSVTLISQDETVGASATAIVSSGGNIVSIVINERGSGYTNTPRVTISSPVGIGTTFATAQATIVNGQVAYIDVTYSGEGYSIENPPQVLIEPPTFNYEEIDNVTYEGDFGIITGVTTAIVGSGLSAINFSLLIPEGSFLRDPQVTNPIIEVSGLTTGYYFVVNNSNIGNGVISLNSDRSVLSIGSSFIDNVYQVYNSEIIRNEITQSITIVNSVTYNSPTIINDDVVVTVEDTGVLTISEFVELRVTTLVDTLSGLGNLGNEKEYFGDYSWGKINANSRKNPKQFNFYPDGIIGITTVVSFDTSLNTFDSTAYTFNNNYSRNPLSRSAVVRRSSPLKYNNYVQ